MRKATHWRRVDRGRHITSWQGQRHQHHQYPWHRLHPRIGHRDVPRGRARPSASRWRAREFVRMRSMPRPTSGRAAGRIGQADVRLDVGPGLMPRMNQVTMTVTDYDKSVAFIERSASSRSSTVTENGYARRNRRRRDPLDPGRCRGVISPTTAIYWRATTSTAKSTDWRGSGSPSNMARAISRGCGARRGSGSVWQHGVLYKRWRRRRFRRGGWRTSETPVLQA